MKAFECQMITEADLIGGLFLGSYVDEDSRERFTADYWLD